MDTMLTTLAEIEERTARQEILEFIFRHDNLTQITNELFATFSRKEAYQYLLQYVAASQVGVDAEHGHSLEALHEALEPHRIHGEGVPGYVPTHINTLKKDLEHHAPSMLFWMESSLGPSHVERMIDVVNGAAEKGFRPVILTSEDTIAAMTQDGKYPLEDYGFSEDVEYVVLPSQSTYAQIKGDFKPEPYLQHSPFEFMGHPGLRNARLKIIDELLESRDFAYIVPELWPMGYGPFMDEAQYMIERARLLNPDVQSYAIGRDIPYQDTTFDQPEMQLHQINTVFDKVLYRGDPVLERFYPEGSLDNISTPIIHAGHYISPGVPDANPEIADDDRKVLVSGGGGFAPGTDADTNPDLQYFLTLIESKPLTDLHDREWEILVSTKCPDHFYALIQEKAEEIGGVTVGRNVPVEEHRQKIADAAAFVVISGYSGLISGIAAGIPTMAVPTNGYPNFSLNNDREIRATLYDEMRLNPDDPDSPRPSTLITMEDLADPVTVAQKFNMTVRNYDPRVRDQFNFSGEATTVNIFTDDYRARFQLPSALDIAEEQVLDSVAVQHATKTAQLGE